MNVDQHTAGVHDAMILHTPQLYGWWPLVIEIILVLALVSLLVRLANRPRKG